MEAMDAGPSPFCAANAVAGRGAAPDRGSGLSGVSGLGSVAFMLRMPEATCRAGTRVSVPSC